jgi:hypothetical protein
MVLAMGLAVGMAASSANAQLIAYWMLDETEGTVAYDGQGNPLHNALAIGEPYWDKNGGVDGKGAAYFHGLSERLQVPEYVDTPLDCKSGPFSIAFWFKVDGPWGPSYQYLAGKGYSIRGTRYSTNRNVQFRIQYGSPYVNSAVPCDDPDKKGLWHHFVGTFGGLLPGQPTEPFELYIDGVSQGYRYDSDATPYDTGYQFAMGGSRYSSSIGLKGWIDNCSMWGIELSADQVWQLYTAIDPLMVNIPPYVYAGPPQIAHIPNKPGARGDFKLRGVVTDQTILGANELKFFWEVWDQAPGDDPIVNPNPGPVIFSSTEYDVDDPFYVADPCNGMVDCHAQMQVPGIYYLVLSASDGVYEANSVFKCDVRPWGWTGELIAYEFEHNLKDTGADSEEDDSLIAYRHYQYNVDEDETDKVIVNLLVPYEEGIVGEAIRLEEFDINPYTSPPPRNDYIASTGTLLKTNASFDTALHGFGSYTVEMFLKPDGDTNHLQRLLYMAEVNYDDVDANTDVWYTVLDYSAGIDYEFGCNMFQASGDAVTRGPVLDQGMRYGFSQLNYEVITYPERWNHVAVVADGYNTTMWVNGTAAWVEGYDGTLASALLSEDGLRIGSEFGNRGYNGLLDDVRINLLPQYAPYFKARTMMIPIQLHSPADGDEYVSVDTVLKWFPGNGSFDYDYKVELRDKTAGGPWQTIATVTDGTTHDPSGAYELVANNEYRWRITPIPDGTVSAIWLFKTLPVGYKPLLGHWKFDENTGKVEPDVGDGLNSAGFDWNYEATFVGDGNPDWIDGWTYKNEAGNPVPRKYAAHVSGALKEPELNEQINYIVVKEPNLTDFFIPNIEKSDPCAFEDLPLDRYSLAMWFNAGLDGFQNNNETMFSLGDSYALRRSGTTNYAAFAAGGVVAVGGSNPHVAATPTNVNDAQWHHLVGVYDNIEDVVRFYVDGQLEDTAEFDYTNFDDIHTIDREAELWMGGNSRYYTRAFSGDIDDVRVYQHKVLTLSEVQALYNMGYSHKRPAVDAGAHQILAFPTTAATMAATVVCDMLAPAGSSTLQWTKVDGPGSVNFAPSANVEDPTVTFGATGVYTLRLTCHDSAYDPSDEVKIWVQPDIPGDYDNVIAYWRFEADEDVDPMVLEVDNEVPFGTSLFNVLIYEHQDEPNYVPRLDPNVPVTPIPLTGAANAYALGRMADDHFMEMVATPYDELVYPEDITVEFYAYFGEEDNESTDLPTTILGYFGVPSTIDEASDFTDKYSSGFWITDPLNVTVHYFVDSKYTGRPQLVEVQTNINLCSPDENGDSKGYRHFAWTYDSYYGVSRFFVDGEQALVTHVNHEHMPGEYFYDGPDNRRLLLNLNSEDLILNRGLDTSALIDEVRITAATLLPSEFLDVGENHCDTLQHGELMGDFNGDCQEDLLDYAIIAGNWMKNTDPYPDGD